MSKIFESKITLETYDAKTGALCERAEGTNFVGQATVRYMKWTQRYLYRQNMATLGGTDSDSVAPAGPPNCVFLTDSTLAEDSANEYTFPGQLIGWANKTTYAGADTVRGTPNTSQLDAQTGYTKWVFDWPTNAANGTINSVGFGRTAMFDYVGGSPSRTLVHQGGSVEQVWTTPSQWNYFAQANSNLAFAQTSGTSISVLDGTYSQTTTFNVTSQFSVVSGIAWDRTNSFLWVVGTSGANKAIAAYNQSGVLQTGPFTLTSRTYSYLAHDGTNLWAAVQTTGTTTVTLYKLNSTSGADMTNFATTLPNTDGAYKISGLAWEPTFQRLWLKAVTTTNNGTFPNDITRGFLRSFNTSGTTQTPDISLNPTDMTGTGIQVLYSTGINSGAFTQQDFDIIDAYQFAVPTNWNSVNRIARFRPDGLHTRSLLGSPVTKTNTQTLKLIYQINYV